MLLSRFWYFLLAAVFGAALTAALLAQTIFNREYDDDLANGLRRDRAEVELWLRIDARSRIDAIAPLAAQPDVRAALRKADAQHDTIVDPKDRRALDDKLRSLNRQLEEMRGDLVFAVDEDGLIVGQIGSVEPPPGAGLGDFPLVRRALTGDFGNDVWVYNDQVYRMAARPVIDHGQYVGALVYGMAVDDKFAEKLAKKLQGASMAFFEGNQVIASYVPPEKNAPSGPEMGKPLAKLLSEPALKKGKSTEPVQLDEQSRAIYSLVSGSAAYANVGYVVGRPRHVLTSPLQVFERASRQDVRNLPWLLVAGLPLGLFALAMLWIFLERDRPLRRLRDRTGALAQQGLDRIDIGDFRGWYRHVAQNVNDAMDKAVAQASTGTGRRAANLDEILGPTPGEEGARARGGYFGFASERPGPSDDEVPSVPPPGSAGMGARVAPAQPAARQPQPPIAPAAPPAPEPPAPAPAAPPAARPAPEPPAPTRAAPAPPAGPPPVKPRPAPATPPKPAAAAPPLPTPAAGAATAVPKAAAPKPAAPKPAAPAAPPARPATPKAPEAASPGDGETAQADGNDEEAYFHEIYEHYVRTKQECGEPTTGLTYEKFAQTLRRNRDQIAQRTGAKEVRFSVYKKNGKAALKATPVKEA